MSSARINKDLTSSHQTDQVNEKGNLPHLTLDDVNSDETRALVIELEEGRFFEYTGNDQIGIAGSSEAEMNVNFKKTMQNVIGTIQSAKEEQNIIRLINTLIPAKDDFNAEMMVAKQMTTDKGRMDIAKQIALYSLALGDKYSKNGGSLDTTELAGKFSNLLTSAYHLKIEKPAQSIVESMIGIVETYKSCQQQNSKELRTSKEQLVESERQSSPNSRR